MPDATIRIKEKAFADDVFTIIISVKEAGDYEEEAEVQLPNPYD